MSDLTMGGTYQIAINNVNNAPTADQKIKRKEKKRKEKKRRKDWTGVYMRPQNGQYTIKASTA